MYFTLMVYVMSLSSFGEGAHGKLIAKLSHEVQ